MRSNVTHSEDGSICSFFVSDDRIGFELVPSETWLHWASVFEEWKLSN